MPTPTFTSESHRLRVALFRAADWLTRELTAFLAPFDLTPPQINALRILRGRARLEAEGSASGSFSTSDLRDALLTHAPDVPRLVDRLVAKGLVSKKPCDHDARRVHLALTEAGRALLERVDAERDALDALTSALSDTEAAHLADALDRLTTS